MTPAEIERQVERFKAALQQAGIRQTHQRVVIYRHVLTSDDHPDVDSVYQSVRKQLPEVSLDTVYRTLWMATDLGLLATLGPREAKVRFDSNLRQHHHFLCRNCGAVVDFESKDLERIELPAEASGVGRAESVHVEIRGLCADCARRPTKARR